MTTETKFNIFLVVCILMMLFMISFDTYRLHKRHQQEKRPPHPCGTTIEPGETCGYWVPMPQCENCSMAQPKA